METVALHLEPVFLWLLRVTAQASVLVCLVLLLQWTLGRRLGIGGRWFLWLVLLVLLVLPWAPHSHNRLDDWFSRPLARARRSSLVRRWSQIDAMSAVTSAAPGPEGWRVQRADETMGCKKLPWPAARGLGARTVRALALVWLSGTIAFLGTMACAYFRLRRCVGRADPVSDPAVLSLLDECRHLMGVGVEVDVLAIDGIGGAALFGHRRPRLLLPSELVEASDPSELRHILVHELAHLRRRDILVGHVVTLVHALQWFNPLMGLAFRRLRADRELACDALALSVLGPGQTNAYGRTVVRQLERLRAARRPPILAAMAGDKSRIKQRIASIAGFDGTRRYRSPLMIVFGVSLACVGLAGSRVLGEAAESAVVTWDVRARRNLPTTHQDKHANIQRVCIRNMMTGKFLVVNGETVTCDADEPGDRGLWEYRFDEVSNTAENPAYFYSVAARKYLTSDEQGRLAVCADAPNEAARWGSCPRPQGVWLVSHHYRDGYLCPSEDGQVKAARMSRNAASYWDVHAVWRVKTSDDPAANPQWQRGKVPGPD